MVRSILRSVCILLASVIVLSGCSFSPEDRVLDYFERNIGFLKNNIEMHFGQGISLSVPSEEVTVSEGTGEHTVVEYTFKGFFPSPQYYGFFFSPDDVPVSFQNSGIGLTQTSENEWKWLEESGDNHGYVRRIEPFWFYFEADF